MKDSEVKNRARRLIREAMLRVIKEQEDPCWDGYTMAGMKTKDGERVPNCVPEEDTDNYDPDESVREMTTTMAVPGYNTPFAFKKDDEDEEEKLEERLRAVNRLVGYTDLDELTTPEALQDFKAYFGPYMKRNKDIAESIRRTLLRPARRA
jgi:hypothetical protein